MTHTADRAAVSINVLAATLALHYTSLCPGTHLSALLTMKWNQTWQTRPIASFSAPWLQVRRAPGCTPDPRGPSIPQVCSVPRAGPTKSHP
jgi:hypothetical protein